jgi:hypothetical protein
MVTLPKVAHTIAPRGGDGQGIRRQAIGGEHPEYGIVVFCWYQCWYIYGLKSLNRWLARLGGEYSSPPIFWESKDIKKPASLKARMQVFHFSRPSQVR